MNIKIFICLLIVCVAINYSSGLDATLTANLWNTFKKTHGKAYHSDEAEQFRFNQFKSNLEIIEQHNMEYAAGLHGYTLGINHYADWSFAEYRAKLLGYRADLNRTKSELKFKSSLKAIALPAEIDWRKQGAVTDVKNQGDCGSCYTFSATGALEGAYAKASGQLVSLSEQQLVDCSTQYGNNGCDGGLMDNVFKYVIENGITTEDAYPYKGVQADCKYQNDTAVVTCKSFVDVPTQDEDALKEALATVGPISVAIDATQEKFMLYKEGVFVDSTCGNEEDKLNHGVLVVGYGSQSVHSVKAPSKSHQDFWIVKNSWGPTWGESGYIRMARNKGNMCGIATTASYPVVK